MAAERPVRPLVMALLFGRLVEAHCLRYRELATHSVAMATGKAEPRVLHGSGCLTRGRLSSEEVSGQGARSLVVFLLFRDGRVENFALELQVRLVYARLRLGVMLD